MPSHTRYFFLVIVLLLNACNNNDAVPEAGNTIVSTRSEKQIREQITQYPDSLLLKENLVQYFREAGNYEEAIKETDKMLLADSLNDRLLDIRATLYFENGDTLQAIASFEKALEINPQPAYIISLGSLYAQTSNPLALAMADALLQAPKANAQVQAIFIKGLYYSYAGEKVKALSYFNTCLKMDYRNLLAYREKAICLYDLEKYASAIDVLTQAVTVQQTFDEAYYWMGRCYEKLAKKEAAIENYQVALQLDPQYQEAKEGLARLGVKL